MAVNANRNSVPALSVGIGLKPAHYRDAVPPDGDAAGAGRAGFAPAFFEVHAENYMGAGGPPHAWLTRIRAHNALSIHGVCLSIGGRDDLDTDHLARLAALVRRYQPALVSEHLAWSAHDGVFYNDLIAPPLTSEALARIASHVSQTQDALDRRILIENPSQYLALPGEIPEPEFLNELARRSGCGLLLDINNVIVSAHNLDFDAAAYVDAIDPAQVEEVHLAGHATDAASGLKIDDHGSPVSDATAALYKHFIARAGARPTLIEWDTDTPDFAAMCGEAARADCWMRDALAEARMAPEADHVVA